MNQSIRYPIIVDNVPSPNASQIMKVAPWVDDTSRLYYAGIARSNGNNDERHIPNATVLKAHANPSKSMKIIKQDMIAEKNRQ